MENGNKKIKQLFNPDPSSSLPSQTTKTETDKCEAVYFSGENMM